jgi:hypothetical protein
MAVHLMSKFNSTSAGLKWILLQTTNMQKVCPTLPVGDLQQWSVRRLG